MEDPKDRHILNTISGGFAGGGESSSSRKKYVRQGMLIDNNESILGREENITVSAADYEGVVPHDDNPMVVTLQIFNWDVKRVLIDQASQQKSFIMKLLKSLDWIQTTTTFQRIFSRLYWRAGTCSGAHHTENHLES